MPWVELAETDIHYIDEGKGQPIVFLHGMSSCAEAWFQQREAFAGDFRVLAYDSVNHGLSANSPRDQPEPDRADELEGFLAALGIERPILAGNSMGALTILRWACRHPDEATALIPSGMGLIEEADMTAARRRGLFDPVDNETLLLPIGDSLTEGFKNGNPRLYSRYLRIRSTATRLEAVRHPRQRTAESPAIDELAVGVKAITSPTLVVVGALDWMLPAAQRLHSGITHSNYVEIAGSPHNVYYETAAEYNQAVKGFLAEVAP
jgi:pimeloyl-ACP methyl ester carboxylesterase